MSWLRVCLHPDPIAAAARRAFVTQRDVLVGHEEAFLSAAAAQTVREKRQPVAGLEAGWPSGEFFAVA